MSGMKILAQFALSDLSTSVNFRWVLFGTAMVLQEEKREIDFSTGIGSSIWVDVKHTVDRFQMTSRPEKLEIIAKSLLDAAEKMKELFPPAK